MDINYLKKVLKVFDESSARELEIEEEDVKIKISRNGGEAVAQMQAPVTYAMPAQPMQTPPPPQAAPAQPAPEASPAPQAAAPASNLHEVTSPIVGTFYRSPAPDADPFVEVGSKVSVGSTLCIVEAMKLMNEIESDVAGTVEEILLKDTDAVEFGQALFRIKPD